MNAAVDHFKLLHEQRDALLALSNTPGVAGYFADEALRFYSIAGTLKSNDMLRNGSAEERQISHILGRSLLEGFFWVAYIFDDAQQWNARFDERVNAFRREYGKFWNERLVPQKEQMEPAGPDWHSLPRPMDFNAMLAQLRNVHGDRLNYLYFIYRVASFDTHGNSVERLFDAAFGKSCNFSALDFNYVFDLIANQYLHTLEGLRAAGLAPQAS